MLSELRLLAANSVRRFFTRVNVRSFLRAFVAITMLWVSITASAKDRQGQGSVWSKTELGPKQLKPLVRRGRPFFPIGAYGRPRPASGKGFIPLAAVRNEGWNTVLISVPKDTNEFRQFMFEAETEGFGVILELGNAVKQQDRDEVVRLVTLGRNYPATLGFYIFDEPENIYYHSDAYKKFVTSPRNIGKSRDIGAFIIQKTSWVRPLIRELDPAIEHYVFMCIAWPTYYNKLQPLCQVNMPNEYPTKGTSREFEGPHASIVYDARVAAKAAFEKGNRQGFCYTPFAVNIGLSDRYRYPTVNEFRYSCFAPITQGAMGIIFWAAYRCKRAYAEQVVFPVTRELDSLKEFFLGEWLDEKVVFEPHYRSSKLLKKLDVPAVSGCLRRRNDGKYLLLAVNNTPSSVDATLHLDIKGINTRAREFISGRTVLILNGIIRDNLAPYGVCAYVMDPAADTPD